MVTLRSVDRAGLHVIHALDDIALAALEVIVGEPMGATAFEILENVKSDKVSIRCHPCWIVGAGDERNSETGKDKEDEFEFAPTTREEPMESGKAYPFTHVLALISG